MPETHIASGKIREIYAIDDERLLLVASDRISTFDVVLPTEIPDKGRVLTGLSAFWFSRTREICPNHLLGLRPDGLALRIEDPGLRAHEHGRPHRSTTSGSATYAPKSSPVSRSKAST